MSYENQIAELNGRVKVRVWPSKVHGVGLIATQNLKKGEKLFADHMPVAYNLPYSEFHRLLPEVREILLERWPQIVNGSAFFYPDTKLQAYCNHSETPNYSATEDTMLKDVKRGEEIFEDYRLIKGYEIVFPWLNVVK